MHKDMPTQEDAAGEQCGRTSLLGEDSPGYHMHDKSDVPRRPVLPKPGSCRLDRSTTGFRLLVRPTVMPSILHIIAVLWAFRVVDELFV